MSRTKKGKKSPGFDFWSKRPFSGLGFGKFIKKRTHKKERSLGKKEAVKAGAKLEKEEK